MHIDRWINISAYIPILSIYHIFWFPTSTLILLLSGENYPYISFRIIPYQCYFFFFLFYTVSSSKITLTFLLSWSPSLPLSLSLSQPCVLIITIILIFSPSQGGEFTITVKDPFSFEIAVDTTTGMHTRSHVRGHHQSHIYLSPSSTYFSIINY